MPKRWAWGSTRRNVATSKDVAENANFAGAGTVVMVGYDPVTRSLVALPLADGGVGPQGEQGPQGDAGPQGPQGLPGIKGDAGDAGVQGATGATGATGGAGATGATGATGAPGIEGAVGPTGATGPAGAKGDPGSVAKAVVPFTVSAGDLLSTSVVKTLTHNLNTRDLTGVVVWSAASPFGAVLPSLVAVSLPDVNTASVTIPATALVAGNYRAIISA